MRSDPSTVLDSNNIKSSYSNINIDGGNVVKHKQKAILTERVFEENEITRIELISQLSKELNAELFFIPAIPDDLTGHSDGHVRFINKNTLLVNELKYEDKKWVKGFLKMVRQGEFNFVEMPWFEDKYNDSAIGIYVNYLEIGNVIIFPVFEVAGNKDDEAVSIIKTVFPDRIIETVNINEVAKEGGLLNCISWNIKR